MKKTIVKIILITVYIISLIIELWYFVPYNKIEIFPSKENVPHIAVIGSGYTSMVKISHDVAVVKEREWNATGKRVDTSQLVVNLLLTTLIFAAIYFMFLIKQKKAVNKTAATEMHNTDLSSFDLPYLDISNLAFADEETIRELQKQYAEDLYNYIKDKINKNIYP